MMDQDILRLETKLDKLTEAVMRLVVLEERQIHTTEMLRELQVSQAVTDENLRKLEKSQEKWINRGIGAWAVACILWAAIELFIKTK